jgi:hypothetical protein
MNKPELLPASRLFQINSSRGVLRILPGLIVGVEKLFVPSLIGDNHEPSAEPLFRVRIHLETAIDGNTSLDVNVQTKEQQENLFNSVSIILESYMEDEGEEE